MLFRTRKSHRPFCSDLLLRTSTIIAIMITILMASSLGGCGKGKQQAMSPPTVEVMTVIQKDVPIYAEWIGTLDGYVNATIRAQVQGYLIRQTYTEGDFVRKGQALFEIDPRTFQATLDQAKSQVALSQARWRQSKANLDRVRPLAAESALSQKDLDDAIASEQSAQASLQSAQSELERARINLEFTKIISPIDGIAGLAKAQIGNLVGPGQTEELTTVSQVDPIKVYVSLSELQYLKAMELQDEAAANASGQDSRKGRKSPELALILADGKVYPFSGSFVIADRQVDVKTGTIKIAASFPNPRNVLKPGQYGRVRAVTRVKKDALLVPQRAVMEIQGKYLVALVGPGSKAEFRPVRTAEQVDGFWIIEQGLKPGDTVIVEGIMKLKPGVPVVPKPFVEPSAAQEMPQGKREAEPSATVKTGKE